MIPSRRCGLAPLDSRARAALPDSAFAYVDSKGRRRLPINDAPHVRNALARFEQTVFEDNAARERARQRLLKAAQKYRISPIGFFDGQLRKERRQAEHEAKTARMAQLPKGMVTFLLADVEGSTAMAQRLGDAWPGLLNDAWRLIGAAVDRARGDGVDMRGDEYLAVFRRPADALDAAIRIQLQMAKHRWPPGLGLRVRIGLHSGTPTIADSSYAGIVMHTLARVCSAGHGGQVLVSSAVRELLGDERAATVGLRALGRYTLAGIAEPQALFQVEYSGLGVEFPRLRAKLASRSEKPASAN